MIYSIVCPLPRPYENSSFPTNSRYTVVLLPRAPRLSVTADKQALEVFHKGGHVLN